MASMTHHNYRLAVTVSDITWHMDACLPGGVTSARSVAPGLRAGGSCWDRGWGRGGRESLSARDDTRVRYLSGRETGERERGGGGGMCTCVCGGWTEAEIKSDIQKIWEGHENQADRQGKMRVSGRRWTQGHSQMQRQSPTEDAIETDRQTEG